jgi:hypothetical protein
MKQAGQQLALGQITGCPEEDQHVIVWDQWSREASVSGGRGHRALCPASAHADPGAVVAAAAA